MKRFLSTVFAAAAILACGVQPSHAAPIPYVNSPLDTPQALVNSVVSTLNTTLPSSQYVSSCTGTTTATCQGLKIAASYTGLTTAAGVTSAAQTVTDASVTAASVIFCQVNGYGGTGNPAAVNVVPGAGSFTYQVQNTHASAALNATVVTTCMIYN